MQQLKKTVISYAEYRIYQGNHRQMYTQSLGIGSSLHARTSDLRLYKYLLFSHVSSAYDTLAPILMP